MHYDNSVDSPGIEVPVEMRQYDCLDWTMDLIQVISEDKQKVTGKPYANWHMILEWVDILEWSRDVVEEIMAHSLGTGHLYEPSIGFFSLVNHDFYRGGSPRDNDLVDGIRIHSLKEREGLRDWMNLKRSQWDARRGTPNAFVTLRIEQIPQDLGDRILGILRDAGITRVVISNVPGGI